ncbi:large subunit ribosomal protein L30 [Thermovibrio guaymasensis]|uniref:Large ribosomal subunit protein uL30 n=1 Tax=Thermovibrio guaymasensis TaxID=240167 RepID=A0A420W726_9BACT|nr:50S ribosomal protein L30 [Thermovibrio guaymasensis]RKQ61891.1 large subunit ribosomal protein L30 [Thermovibrio guaymasensis]
MAKVKITLIRGLAGKSKRKKATLAALGLHKRGATTIKELNPAIEGMIEKVKELVKVEPVEE